LQYSQEALKELELDIKRRHDVKKQSICKQSKIKKLILTLTDVAEEKLQYFTKKVVFLIRILTNE
jgi:hypothetical protein